MSKASASGLDPEAVHVVGPVSGAIAYEKIVLTPYRTRNEAVQESPSNEPAD